MLIILKPTIGFIWDDDDYITENMSIQTWDGLPRIWFDLHATPQYYPLVHTTFWLENRLWGLNATGYHVKLFILLALSTAGRPSHILQLTPTSTFVCGLARSTPSA